MSFKYDIYAIRSAASPIIEPGATGEDLRNVTAQGEAQIRQLGGSLTELVGGPLAEVRFAPANRTRNTALLSVALTYSSIELVRDKDLTNTDPEFLIQYLKEISSGPTVLFTHLDVIQSMVEAVESLRPDDQAIPTASLTKFESTPSGLALNYVGRTVDQAAL